MPMTTPAKEPKPKQLIVDPKRALMYVRWQDDHESLIPLHVVREACPCAFCEQARRRLAQGEPDETFSRASIEPTAVSEAGNYALHIYWADGHSGGYYTWSLLRSLCPCEACQASRS
ncbi:MAG: DUF971 domain-containing protein [Ardenticatenia bacterium]|nr:MAG: DUF971 domain-containing protein [Ardenticatenia bacterium]